MQILNKWLRHPSGTQALAGIAICLISSAFLIKGVGGFTRPIGYALGIVIMAIILITSILINYFKAKKKN